MQNSNLFNSKTAPIPRLRPDLDIIPINNNGESCIYFHDMRGYATPNFALERSAGAVLSLLNGQKSIVDLKSNLGNGITTQQLLQYIQFLDEHRLLYSSYFREYAQKIELEYEKSTVHHSVTAGSSYPDDPDELRAFLDEAFANNNVTPLPSSTGIKALYAPHIDPRVGMKSYVQSFQMLQNLSPKRVVILATSHYAGLYPQVYKNKPFIVSNKDFELPLGTIPADREAIDNLLKSAENTGICNHDRAHRIEHSIELHLLFLSYLWKHSFSIVPILVGGFDELCYMQDGYLAQQINNFTTLMRDKFAQDNDTLFLISGDLAHFGKKFGDNRPARSMFDEVSAFDKHFLEHGLAGSSDKLLGLVADNNDQYRICGFPPLYTFLKIFPNISGLKLSYDLWDETERKSAVTFGSILYE